MIRERGSETGERRRGAEIERHERREGRDATEGPRSLECRAARRAPDHVTP